MGRFIRLWPISIYLSIYTYIHTDIYICIYIYLSVCLSVCLTAWAWAARWLPAGRVGATAGRPVARDAALLLLGRVPAGLPAWNRVSCRLAVRVAWQSSRPGPVRAGCDSPAGPARPD